MISLKGLEHKGNEKKTIQMVKPPTSTNPCVQEVKKKHIIKNLIVFGAY